MDKDALCMQNLSLLSYIANPISSDVKEAISRSISTMFGLQKAKDSRGMKFAPTYKLAFSLLNQDSSEGDAVLDWNVDELLQGG